MIARRHDETPIFYKSYGIKELQCFMKGRNFVLNINGKKLDGLGYSVFLQLCKLLSETLIPYQSYSHFSVKEFCLDFKIEMIQTS